jgi:hypothetical protein
MLVGLTHDFWHHLRGAGVFGGVDRGWSLRSTDDDPLGSRRVRSWRGLEGQGDGPAWEWKSSQRRRVERNLENRLVSTSQPAGCSSKSECASSLFDLVGSQTAVYTVCILPGE